MRLEKPAVISLGFVKVYLVPAEGGCALVDAGVPGQEDRILAGLAQHGLPPEALRLIFITHAHGDHMGSLKALAERTHARVVAHRNEAPTLTSGAALHPHGLTTAGKVMSAFMGRFVKAAAGFPCAPDVVVDDELSLAEFGVAGRAIHTPGHTAGSLTLLLDSGEAFSGDLCAKMSPLGRSYLPPFGDDLDTVYASWRRLLDAGATTLYPGHGASIPAAELAKELARAGR
jgi:hydroxyacylglutathione hydrolase